MACFSPSQKGSAKPNQEADGGEKEIGSAKPAEEAEPAAVTEEGKDADKKSEETTEATEAADGKADAKSLENDRICEMEGTTSDEKQEMTEVEGVIGADGNESEGKEPTNKDADGMKMDADGMKMDEDGMAVEMKTGAEEGEQNGSCDAVAMDVDGDNAQPQSSQVQELEEDSSRCDEENKSKDDDEPMETVAADRDNSAIVASDSSHPNDQTSGEAKMDSCDAVSDEVAEKPEDETTIAADASEPESAAAAEAVKDANKKDDEVAFMNVESDGKTSEVCDEKVKVEEDGLNGGNAAKESDVQNAASSNDSNAEKKTGDTGAADEVEELDVPKNKKQTEESISAPGNFIHLFCHGNRA